MPRCDANHSKPWALVLMTLAIGSVGCFPRFDLPPGEALPDQTLLAPIGTVLPFTGELVCGDLSVDRARVAVVTRSDAVRVHLADLATASILDTSVLPHEVSAVRFFARGSKLAALRVDGTAIDVFSVREGAPCEAHSYELVSIGERAGLDLVVDPAHDVACVLRALGRLDLVDVATGQSRASADLRASVTACAISDGGTYVACALAREDAVLLLEGASLVVRTRVALGDAPRALRFDESGSVLHVQGTRVHTIDVLTGEVLAQAPCAMMTDAPPAHAIDLGWDRKRSRLYVANSLENSIGVVDVSDPAEVRCLGLLPTDRAPHAAFTDGRWLAILNDRSLEITPAPMAEDLARATATVRRNHRPRP